MSAWPSAVWSTPLLRDLDLRARREIEAAGSLRQLEVGQRLFEAGSPADALFVVAEGSVSLRTPENAAQVLRSARSGEALGEEALATHFGARTLPGRLRREGGRGVHTRGGAAARVGARRALGGRRAS